MCFSSRSLALLPQISILDKACDEYDGVAHFICPELPQNKALNYSVFIIHLQLYLHD